MQLYNSELLKDRRVAARDKPVLFFSAKGAHEDRILTAEQLGKKTLSRNP
jgi:aminoglycoside N3'-acetyltransferase